MIAVGITGSFASGKTLVLKHLANIGFDTFLADQYVKTLYQDPKIQNEVLGLLPSIKIFDKTKIAQLIYNDELARYRLQNFVHPFVLKELMFFKLKYKLKEFTFAEIPLLFETGYNKYFDFIVVTFCSEELRLQRAKVRECFNQEIYNKIMKIQLPQYVKMRRADFIIDTNGNLQEVKKQIIQLIEELKCNN